jgi:hypothetical protein
VIEGVEGVAGVQEFRSSGVQEFSCARGGLDFVKPGPFKLPDL